MFRHDSHRLGVMAFDLPWIDYSIPNQLAVSLIRRLVDSMRALRTPNDALVLALGNGHDGPWNESELLNE